MKIEIKNGTIYYNNNIDWYISPTGLFGSLYSSINSMMKEMYSIAGITELHLGQPIYQPKGVLLHVPASKNKKAKS